jgi:hypothetical protein
LIMIALIVVLFVLALVIPFPTHDSSEHRPSSERK